MQPTRRQRAFAALTNLLTHRPWTILGVGALMLICAAAAIPGLSVSTSRYGLVSRDNPYQERLFQFFEQFGYPDSPLFIVEGGSATDRRAFIDTLTTELGHIDILQHRILSRIGPHEVAEVVLLNKPELLVAIEQASGGDPQAMVEGGLTTIAATLLRHLNALAMTLHLQSVMPLGNTITHASTKDMLGQLASLANTLHADIEGRNKWHEWIAQYNQGDSKHGCIDQYGYLSADDDSAHIIITFPDLPHDEVALLKPLVVAMRTARDRAEQQHAGKGIRASLTGIPTLAVDELALIHSGMTTSGVVTALAVLLLFMLAFRSWRQTVLAAVPLLAGLTVALAACHLLYGRLTLVTSCFIALLLGLCIDFSVHLLSRYNERRRAGMMAAQAITEAIRLSGAAILTGALTTCLAFFTIVMTEFTAFAELGVLTAIGLLASLLATFLLVPALIVVRAQSKASQKIPAPEIACMRYFSCIQSGRARGILILTVVSLIFTGTTLSNISFNARYFDFLPNNIESATGLQRFEHDSSISPIFGTVTAGSIEEARHLAKELRARPEVASVQTASDLLPPLTQASLTQLQHMLTFKRPIDFDPLESAPTTTAQLLPIVDDIIKVLAQIGFSIKLMGHSDAPVINTTTALADLRMAMLTLPHDGGPYWMSLQKKMAHVARRAWDTARAVAKRGAYATQDLPAIIQTRFVSHDQKRVALFVFPSGDPWDQNFAKKFTDVLEDVDPNATGFAITTYHHTQMVVTGFKQAAGLATLFVLCMLFWDFRCLRHAALAMLPVVVGFSWMLNIMSLFGIQFNVANIVALPLVLGIGVDTGVHMVHRARESAQQNAGKTKLDELFRGTGGAVLLSSATTMAGFAGLMTASYGAMTSLGLVMLLGVGACTFASLVVLPAALIALNMAESPTPTATEYTLKRLKASRR